MSPVSDLARDLRFALRMLRRQPAFAAAATLMLALGIGANATVFSWLQTTVLSAVPGVSDPSTLVAVVQSDPNGTWLPLASYPDFEDLAATPDVFSGVIGSRSTEALLERGGRSRWIAAAVATVNIFDVLGVRPALGRTFRPDEDAGEGAHPVAVIGNGLWRREFGGDPAVVGRTIRVNRHAFTVVGVLPSAFVGVTGGSSIDLWTPLAMHEAILDFGSYTSRTFRWIQPMARLRSGVGVARAQAALAVVSDRLAAAYPASNAGVAFRAFPLRDSPFGSQAAFLPALRIVFAMTGGILLIVIANVSCLLLARAARRDAEFAVRLAIGAGRSRLVRQLLAEGLVLGLIGAGGGLAFARWGVPLLPRLAPAATAPFAFHFSLNLPAVAFAVSLSIVTAVLFGLAPALTSSGSDLATSLRSSARGAIGIRRHRALGALVVTEVALAIVLLIGAGLCVKGFQQARRLDLGFDPAGVVYASLNLVPNGYTPERGKIFDRALRERLVTLPGVTDAAFVNTPPLSVTGRFTGTVDVEGNETQASESRAVPFAIVSPGYFSVMRIPLLQGRPFEDADDGTRPNVAIVTDAMVRQYWRGMNPIGRRFRMAVGILPTDTFEVIGVARTATYGSLAEPPAPMVYVTYLQRPLASLFMNLLVRTSASAEQLIPALRREVHAVDPAVEPLRVVTLEEYIQPAFLPVRIAATLLVMLGATALLLAAAGLYAVMSYAVAQRRQEIGIRLALGARAEDAVRMIMRDGMTLVAAGIGLGLLGSLALARLLARFLYGVSTTDLVTFAGGPLLLAGVALIACGIPARRVSHLDPLSAIRAE